MNGDEPHDHHGGERPRGTSFVPRSSSYDGRFGRMFRPLPALSVSDAELVDLARGMCETTSPPAGDNPGHPAGYTFLGQLVDHDITFDPVSSLERRNDPDALNNFRTPRFDLDSLYGSGRHDSPYLYDQEDPVKLLVGLNTATIHEPVDLPRNHQGRALIGDPRNDVHVILSQMHLALVRFHNAAVDHLRSRFFPDHELFEEARRLTLWHYQWVVVEDFLRRLVRPEVLETVIWRNSTNGRLRTSLQFYKWKRRPYIPVEFSVAAYRFGHSQVRPAYKLNDTLEPLPILTDVRVPHPLQHLGGFRPLPKRWTVQWNLFFDLGGATPQLSRKIDTRLSKPMCALPVTIDRNRRSLALLNLLRGRSLGLPSGQAVAAAMGTTVPDEQLGLSGETPLWHYVLREAEVLEEGRRLGPTGGRIVAEVLVGLLQGDQSSFLRVAPGWKPELPSAEPGRFTMPDLLRFAGVA
ncbi:MAG: Animal haem peroxidase [uncultured Acidimicrobiales bacterium]|uniref:Animal haem peroxidase n=1 Tax=uncultured Acidimicrobiales bacterium TaxID=310071 RepID=A0A6J4HD60_9ACTN|nr:MAG: Animal haem peroxidase [uncultured Acidimicrobiales bacterium]